MIQLTVHVALHMTTSIQYNLGQIIREKQLLKLQVLCTHDENLSFTHNWFQATGATIIWFYIPTMHRNWKTNLKLFYGIHILL